jgi:hypothetical protein
MAESSNRSHNAEVFSSSAALSVQLTVASNNHEWQTADGKCKAWLSAIAQLVHQGIYPTPLLLHASSGHALHACGSEKHLEAQSTL